MVNKKLTNSTKEQLFSNNLEEYKDFCGIDEAGRGPIAGPLLFAAVILKRPIDGLNDSKKLSEKRRELLFEEIKRSAHYFIYQVDAAKIDTIGLSCAIQESLLAIKAHCGKREYLFDGKVTFGVSGLHTMVKADGKVANVSAASILAKVTRDKLMVEYAKIYPEYGFEKHKGYGTKQHLEAIAKYGYTPIHRRSFKIKLPTKKNTLF